MTSNDDAIILIVDDDEADRFALRRALEKVGVTNEVIETEDGHEVLEILRSTRCQDRVVVLFVDLKMPVIDGHDIVARIRKEPALANHPVFVTSGSDDPRDVERSAALGVLKHLTKPVPGSVVGALVEGLIDDGINIQIAP